MTAPRVFVITILFIGSGLLLLAFGSPHWPWSYMFQNQIWPADGGAALNIVKTSEYVANQKKRSSDLMYYIESTFSNNHFIYVGEDRPTRSVRVATLYVDDRGRLYRLNMAHPDQPPKPIR